MSQQLQRVRAVWATAVVLGAAALTFLTLTLTVGDTSETQPTPAPTPVLALDQTPSRTAPATRKAHPSAVARKKSTRTHTLDAWQRLARRQTLQARRQLRAARRRHLGVTLHASKSPATSGGHPAPARAPTQPTTGPETASPPPAKTSTDPKTPPAADNKTGGVPSP